MKIKQLLLGVVLMSSLMITAQTSQEEIAKIAKEQSDGILTSAQSGTKTVYGDGKEAISTVYNDVKSLTPKIASSINEIAKGLKIGAESVWKILVRQQLVWSICFLMLTLGSFINWCMFYKRYLNSKKLTEQDFVKGTKRYCGEKNPDYCRYTTGSQQFKRIEEEILIPIENQNNYWFKYFHLTSCLTLSILSIYHFSAMLTGFINPEYGEMQDIVLVALKIK